MNWGFCAAFVLGVLVLVCAYVAVMGVIDLIGSMMDSWDTDD